MDMRDVRETAVPQFHVNFEIELCGDTVTHDNHNPHFVHFDEE